MVIYGDLLPIQSATASRPELCCVQQGSFPWITNSKLTMAVDQEKMDLLTGKNERLDLIYNIYIYMHLIELLCLCSNTLSKLSGDSPIPKNPNNIYL